jgi:Flp pilus assembly protein TadG
VRIRSTESGSTSLELVLLAPVLLSILLLIAAFGRYSHVQGSLDQAAKDAARSATATRDAGAANDVVESVVAADVASTSTSCSQSVESAATVQHGGADLGSLDAANFTSSDPYDPDQITTVTVTVSCDVDVSDLSFIGFSSIHMESTFSSPVDSSYGIYSGDQP